MKETIVIENHVPEVPFEERFAKIRQAGYRYAELWNLNGRGPAGRPQAGRRKRSGNHWIKRRHFRAPATRAWRTPASCDDYIALVKECMELAKILECKVPAYALQRF